MKAWKIIFWIIVVLVIILALVFIITSVVKAATNIDPVNRYAWEDVDGWWDFYYTDTVNVQTRYLTGYASSSVGDISLDCATSRNGNICGQSNYGVCNGPGPHTTAGDCASGDASGNLTGYGWNDAIGWISFNCDQSSHGGANNCASSTYKVSITLANGDFSGYAWNDVVGWISFNGSNYKVNTSWRAVAATGTLESSIFDTQVTGGSNLNSIIWQGTQPAGTCVKFQIAISNDSGGSWTYFGAATPVSATSTADYYGSSCPGPNTSIVTNYNLGNYRYLRYKVFLDSNITKTATPQVNDVILNWSP